MAQYPYPTYTPFDATSQQSYTATALAGAYNPYSGTYYNNTTSAQHNATQPRPNHSNLLSPSSSRSNTSSASESYSPHVQHDMINYGSYVSPPFSPQAARHSYGPNRNPVSISGRRRSQNDIVQSMLTPMVSELPQPVSAYEGRRASWDPSSLRPSANPYPSPDSAHWTSPLSDEHLLAFDQRAWTEAMSPFSNVSSPALPTQGYTFPPELSPTASPTHLSTAVSYDTDVKRQVSPSSGSSTSPPPGSRRPSWDSSASCGTAVKMCSHCHATSTPLWRRDPTTLKPLCNACGLYLQQRKQPRPQELIDADAAADDSSESDGDGTGPECSHCRTHRTSVWRRSKTGAQLCNACGVYSRLRGRDRPLSLKRNKIKPRSKHTARNI